MKRNVFLLAMSFVALFCFTHESNAQQVIKLFNGKDLSNWDFVVDKNSVPADQVYSVKDGVIHIKGTPFGYMYTKEKYGNYKLHVEWRWPQEATNSGIFLLIEEVKNPFPNGIECQLAAGNAGDFVCLGGSDLLEFQQPKGKERPAFPVVKKANGSSEKPAGEWNYANIFVKNGTITVYINGVYQNTGTNKVKTGHIGLQSEGKDIQFRNVTLTSIVLPK
ncbi:MAG: DUF1080 domain-containing protein [Tannerellaceae bacterium]|nr:DUF1080 domain-containing protein [Tannerellaceae bacterium]